MGITRKQAERLGKKFKVDFDIVKFDEWLLGLNIETEHHQNLEKTARIALDHLEEDYRYYYHLNKMETRRKEYYKHHIRPNVYKN